MDEELHKQKEALGSLNLTNEIIIMTLLELVNLFQTFEDLESVEVKDTGTQAVRQILDVVWV